MPGELGNRLTAQWMGLARAGIAFTAWLLINPVVHVGLRLLCSSGGRFGDGEPACENFLLIGSEEAGNASWGFPKVRYLPSCLDTTFFRIQHGCKVSPTKSFLKN